MPSRKKDRAKQRKAKQKRDKEVVARKESNAGGLDHQQPLSPEELQALATAFKFLPEHLFPEALRIIGESDIVDDDGDEINVDITQLDGSTQRKLQNFFDQHQGQQGLAPNIYAHNYTAELREIVRRLSDPRSGVNLRNQFLGKSFHTQLLSFFGQCRDKLPVQCDVGESTQIPLLWLDILRLIIRLDACPDNVLFEVAKSLGPVVEGIANNKRELFQSNIVWHLCLSPFFELVHCIMKQSRRGFAEMLAHEGFLSFVAQASCWSLSRTDIVAEAGFFQPPDAFHTKVCHGAQTIIGTVWVIDAQNQLEGGDVVSFRHPLEQIARTPLLSNDPNCLDSAIVGLVGLVGCEHQDDLDFLLSSLIYPLLLDKGYVDARVIEAVIDIGRRGSARFATRMMLRPILGLDKELGHIQPQPIDSRYAAAIRAGLLEVLTRDHVHDESNVDFAADHVFSIAKGLYAMAGHSKTSRALRGRKDEILEALGPLRESSSDLSNAICVVVEDAIDFGTPICCNCLKTFDRDVLRFCQGCMIECYCSAACQAESWGAGHSHCCGGLKGEGSNATELKRCNTLRQNLMMNGCRFVQRNIGAILGAMKGRKCNAVKVDFAEYPPRFRLPQRKTGNQHCVGGLECIFISPVHYGFATRNGGKEARVKKVIPHSVVAEIESKSPADDVRGALGGSRIGSG